MSLDFARLKAIPISDVVGRYGIQLRYRAEWGSAICPLPSHKKGEKEKTFSVNTLQNYWKCFSASCNETAGCKGGDTINFVALMDGSTQLAAAKKLAEWFNIGETKSALHIVGRSKETEHQKTYPDPSTPPDTVKYMASIDQWFDELIKPLGDESEADYWKRLLKDVKAKLIESFRSGKAQR
jgi:DNA primase